MQVPYRISLHPAVLWASVWVLAACALSGCSREPDKDALVALPTQFFVGDLDAIRERKVLRALVVPSRTDFYLGQTRWIENPTSGKKKARLERLRPLFDRFGQAYDLDPLALQALAFHESALDQGRRSARGAVGLMQMLPATARDPNVDIADIHKVENNVHAGAKYLAFLRDRYFSSADIDPQARMAFVWAAYNAGPARVAQMRKLAARMGLNPNRWFGHVEVAAGRLVGRETVKYVANIKKYLIAYRLLREHARIRSSTQQEP